MIFVAKKRALMKMLLMMLLFAVFMVVGATGATILHELRLENPIKTPTVEGSIPEDLERGAKKVSFSNDGEADVFLRVTYAETWTAKDGTILPNTTKDRDGKEVVPAAPVWNTEDWYTGSADGWYYYRKVLPGTEAAKKADDRNTGLLVDGVQFLTSEQFADLPDTRYKDADYQLHFTMEIVQASDDWNNVSVPAVQQMFHKDLGAEPANWANNKYEAEINWN